MYEFPAVAHFHGYFHGSEQHTIRGSGFSARTSSSCVKCVFSRQNAHDVRRRKTRLGERRDQRPSSCQRQSRRKTAQRSYCGNLIVDQTATLLSVSADSRVVKPKDAERYWKIEPAVSTEKIVQMPESRAEIKERLRNAEVIDVKPNPRPGTNKSFIVTLADGTQGIFKQEQQGAH